MSDHKAEAEARAAASGRNFVTLDELVRHRATIDEGAIAPHPFNPVRLAGAEDTLVCQTCQGWATDLQHAPVRMKGRGR